MILDIDKIINSYKFILIQVRSLFGTLKKVPALDNTFYYCSEAKVVLILIPLVNNINIKRVTIFGNIFHRST